MQTYLARVMSAVAFVASMSAGGARLAHADDAVEMKRLVAEEVKAQMAAKSQADAKDNVLRARWNNGLMLESADKRHSLRIGGRIHLDTNFIDPDPGIEGPAPGVGDDFDDATFMRRLRMYLLGSITSHVDFKLELDFSAAANPRVGDAYVTLKNLKECWGCWMPSLRVGHFHDPVGLDTTSSANTIAFIERAGQLALHPVRAMGLSLFDSFWHEHAFAQIGVFSTDADDDEDNGFAIWDSNDTDGGVAFTGRFALVPWARDTCHFLHVGASASVRDTSEVRYRARPGLGRGPRVVDTLALTDIDGVTLWNAELGLVWGPLHIAAEYTSLNVDDPARGDPTFTAWYAQVGYFLTGESKAYDFKVMQWGNTKPCCSFLSGAGLDKQCCGLGAFELVARYDTLDLTEGTVRGGELSAWTAGVNWYLTPHTRLMFDVTNQTIENRNTGGVIINDADVLAFLMRVDIHF